MKTSLEKDAAVISCSPDTFLTEYSYGIETAINWFFGRGVYKLKIERSKVDRNQVVTVTPLSKPREFTFSQVCSIGTLVSEGFWPRDLSEDERWRVPNENRNEIRDGQHRIWRSDNECSIIQSFGKSPDTPMAIISYGLADIATGMFWHGAKWVKFQGSLGTTQIITDKGFASADALAKYILGDDVGYDVKQKVSALPN